jgi:Ulp1 family protease
VEDFVFGAELGSGLDVEDIMADVNNDLKILDLDDDENQPIEPDSEDYVILNDKFLESDRLSRTDLGRLEPGEWLSDSLIDLFSGYSICQQISTLDAYQSFQLLSQDCQPISGAKSLRPHLFFHE